MQRVEMASEYAMVTLTERVTKRIAARVRLLDELTNVDKAHPNKLHRVYNDRTPAISWEDSSEHALLLKAEDAAREIVDMLTDKRGFRSFVAVVSNRESLQRLTRALEVAQSVTGVDYWADFVNRLDTTSLDFHLLRVFTAEGSSATASNEAAVLRKGIDKVVTDFVRTVRKKGRTRSSGALFDDLGNGPKSPRAARRPVGSAAPDTVKTADDLDHDARTVLIALWSLDEDTSAEAVADITGVDTKTVIGAMKQLRSIGFAAKHFYHLTRAGKSYAGAHVAELTEDIDFVANANQLEAANVWSLSRTDLAG